MNPRIRMITLGVRDLAASVKFYEKGLGFRRMESPSEPDGHLWEIAHNPHFWIGPREVSPQSQS